MKTLVVATDGSSAATDALVHALGSVSLGVVHEAMRPVLVLRGAATARARARRGRVAEPI